MRDVWIGFCCDDEEIADRLWSVHNVGRTRSGRWYEHHVLGGNFRMTEWQAAMTFCVFGESFRINFSASRFQSLAENIGDTKVTDLILRPFL